MNTTEAILTRRSIREYKTTPVPEELINKILKAGMYAPTAMNLQSWDFIVVNERENIDKIGMAIPHAKELTGKAQAAILVCGNLKTEQNKDYLVQNCSAATQNMLLQIHESGLGGCWVSVYPSSDSINSLRQLFKIPDFILPVTCITSGYPAEKKETEERFSTDKIHYNEW